MIYIYVCIYVCIYVYVYVSWLVVLFHVIYGDVILPIDAGAKGGLFASQAPARHIPISEIHGKSHGKMVI